ncbi:MAG TPA: diaminopimelate epimerase, partial [Pirellulales bacterium]|nr:diaminopimelate epimerase [Pirellulales bacterium]
ELEIEAGRARRVKVDMGQPVLEAEKIPVALPRPSADGRVVDLPLDKYIPMNAPAAWMEDCGLDMRMTCVSMGNPHLVIYCQQVAGVPLETTGPFLETQPIFPRRINVHFVEVHSSGEVTMRSWERGSGITLACGTGASAVCVAGGLTGRTSRRILAHLPGGDLELDWAANDHVYMTGPAVEVFSGEWHGDAR